MTWSYQEIEPSVMVSCSQKFQLTCGEFRQHVDSLEDTALSPSCGPPISPPQIGLSQRNTMDFEL